MKKTYLKRKPVPRVGPHKPRGGSLGTKRGKDAELKREWLIQSNMPLRYSGIRGAYWYWLSRDIRKTEWETYGVCITCLKPMETWEEGQCGHMVPSSMCGEYLRFNRKNLTIQHAKCNNPRFTPQAGALNAVHYDERHGQGAWQRLYDLREKYKDHKEPKKDEYILLIKSLRSFQQAQSLQTLP